MIVNPPTILFRRVDRIVAGVAAGLTHGTRFRIRAPGDRHQRYECADENDETDDPSHLELPYESAQQQPDLRQKTERGFHSAGYYCPRWLLAELKNVIGTFHENQ